MFARIFVSIHKRYLGKKGATTVQYSLMIAFVALVCVLAVTKLGVNLKAVFLSLFAKTTGQGQHGGD